MHIECTKDSIERATSLLYRISGKNVNLPVLSCILFDIKSKKALFRATNLDLGVEIEVPAKIHKEGVIAVPAHILAQYISSLGSETRLTMETNGTTLTITTKHGSSDIQTLPPHDFPSLPIIASQKVFLLPVKALLQGMKSVLYSSSTSSIKPELSSVYMFLQDKKLFFVATDSFRLSEKVIALSNITHVDPILIPQKNISDLIRILESVDDDIEVRVTQTQISLSAGPVFVTSRLIDGVFPDYRQIIPKNPTTVLTCLKEDFISIIKKATIFSDSFHQIGFTINPKKKECLIHSSHSDIGAFRERLEASMTGEEIKINFNYRYLLDCFQSIATDSISLSFSGLGKPLVIRGVGDGTFLYLVMPMNR